MSRQTGLQRLFDWFSGVRLLLHYDRACLSQDLTAGLVVTLVLIPSAIAYADLAKCPPISGLYAALGAMIAFGGRPGQGGRPVCLACPARGRHSALRRLASAE
jgi:MFS superfamily sulfate permease-like transporter